MAGRISRRYALGAGLAVAGGVAAAPAFAGTAFADGDDFCGVPLPWREARRIVNRTPLPHFPRPDFNVLRHRAGARRTTGNTAGLAAAVAPCHRPGGGP